MRIKSHRPRTKRGIRRSLEEMAIHQVELMLKAERKLAGKRPLCPKELHKRARKFHQKHFE